MNDQFFDHRQPIRSGWREDHLLLRGPLTDKKIERYRRRGRYSPEFARARRDLIARKKAKAQKRDGNFIVRDGRMIYSPV